MGVPSGGARRRSIVLSNIISLKGVWIPITVLQLEFYRFLGRWVSQLWLVAWAVDGPKQCFIYNLLPSIFRVCKSDS
jgi:hypothetical protein